MSKGLFHIALRLTFAACLFLSQFISNRSGFFSENEYLLSAGVLTLILGIALFVASSTHLRKALSHNKPAITGPYKYIRHPIYTSMYVISTGLGFLFFTWFWFMIMALFSPFWYLESKEEENEMIRLHGDEYLDYQKSTGMFLPKLIK
jgi:protein-S-isoprenylcysteine O-methyltransferase Ste14